MSETDQTAICRECRGRGDCCEILGTIEDDITGALVERVVNNQATH